MKLEGKWIGIGPNSEKDDEIIIIGGKITWTSRDRKTDSPVKKTGSISFEENKDFPGLMECFDIKITQDSGWESVPEYIVHAENVNGCDIYIISSMTTIFDGPGLVVSKEYVFTDNLGLINNDFKSKLWLRTNNRASGSMTQNSGMAGGMTFMGSQPMNLNSFQKMQDRNPVTQNSDPAKEWTCNCGKTKNYGKFCPECGAARTN